jgi:multiple sugar transport system substrate-binding protein
LSAQVDPDPRPIWLGEAPARVWGAAAGLTFFFDRDAKAELVGPTYDGLRRFLKAPHDTDQVVRHIDEAIKKARANIK